MKINKLIPLFVCLIFIVGCTAYSPKSTGTVSYQDIYGVILNSESKHNNLVFIDKNLNLIGSSKAVAGNYIEDIQLYKNYLIALDTGWLEKPKKDLIKIDLKNNTSKKLELPHSPHRMFIKENMAFISSSNEASNKRGFYLTVINLDDLKIIDEKFIPGMVSAFTVTNGKLYVGINSGGPNNYGQYAQILRIEFDTKNQLRFNNILTDPEEIPPSAMVSDVNMILGVYPGYIGKSKPRWLKNPDAYSHKLKLIDIQLGQIINTLDLPHQTPQNIVTDRNNRGFINHFSNVDMSGEYISVIDLKSKKFLSQIQTISPSYTAVDDKYLYVTNYTTDSVSIFDLNSFKKIKEIKVGKWPKKIILVR